MAARNNAGMRWAAGLAVMVLASAIVLAGQQQQQQQVQIPMTDEQRLEIFVSEMLAAWQIGDLELLHKYYADDVTVVSAAFEPPIIGWTNYAQAYLRAAGAAGGHGAPGTEQLLSDCARKRRVGHLPVGFFRSVTGSDDHRAGAHHPGDGKASG